jgi:hypothetical protein
VEPLRVNHRRMSWYKIMEVIELVDFVVFSHIHFVQDEIQEFLSRKVKIRLKHLEKQLNTHAASNSSRFHGEVSSHNFLRHIQINDRWRFAAALENRF